MAEIIDFKEATKRTKENKETKTKVVKADKDKNNINTMEEALDYIREIGANKGGFEEVVGLLGLPDEVFDIISNAALLEIERAMNNTQDKMLLAQSLEMQGTRIEDVLDSYNQIINTIDSQLPNVPQKRKDFLKQYISIIMNGLLETQKISNRIVQIPIELCREGAKIPTYATLGDAGLDVYALEDYDIAPGETKLIPTGIKVALPIGHEFQVRPRSGQSLKTKLRVANSPGTIDCGFRGEICVIVENIEPKIADIDYEFSENGEIKIKSILHGKSYHISKGSKFAQLVLNIIPSASFFQVESVGVFESERKEGGFGSSDK